MLNHASPDAVVLVSERGEPIGTAPRAAVHGTDTPLHLAFSSYLFDDRGRLLLTRRALHKRTWPGVWTNSCCGHPRPGEAPDEAVRRRVRDEVGVDVDDLTVVLPDFRYRATDAAGMVENELCPVWVGRVDPDLIEVDDDEVADHAWVPWADVVASVSATPHAFSPWSALQVPQLRTLLDDHGRPVRNPDVLDEDTTVKAVDEAVRAELAGLQTAWATWVPDVEVLPVDLPKWLALLAASGGKRFRPRLGHWAYVAVGGVAGHHHLVRASAALELLHLFALVHDDVMDESDARRGAPSAHVQAAAWHRQAQGCGPADTFGRNLAILLGDLAHARADLLADGLPQPLRAAWHELCLELIAGQRADLTGAAAGRRDREHAERIAGLKSGSYSVARPLQLGALAGGASAEQLATLGVFGRHIGRAFALRDDLLGLWGDPELTGKPVGDDLLAGKATVIAALADELLCGDDADLLAGPITDAGPTLRVLERAGIPERVEELICGEVRAAREALAGSTLTEPGIAGLNHMAVRIAWRQA